MRLKVFTAAFVLFVAVFFTSLSLISLYMFHHQLNTVKQKSVAEHYFIAASLGRDMYALQSRGGNQERAFEDAIGLYAVYYTQNGVSMEIVKAGEPVFSNRPAMMENASRPLDEATRTVDIFRWQDKAYTKVSGVIPYTGGEYILYYWYDFTDVMASWQQFKNILLGIGIFFSGCLSFFLQVLLKRIFKPLTWIQQTSRKIAQGHYEDRLAVQGGDEIAAMARSFNHMAEEIQQTIQALSKANAQKQQLVDNLSHDIRTPLTSIYGYAEYMAKTEITEEEKIEMAQVIMQESKYILNTAELLLKMAVWRNEAIQMERVCLAPLFEEIKKMLQLKLAEKGCRLTIDCRLTALEINSGLFTNMMVNLLDNAIAASRPGGEIYCRAYEEEAWKIIAVQDEGKGIAKAHLSRIEEPFYRVDANRNRNAGGAGLGLSIVRQIAVNHGAELSITSEDGIGTTVKIIFTTSI